MTLRAFLLILFSVSAFTGTADTVESPLEQAIPPDSLTALSVKVASNEIPLPEQNVWPESPQAKDIRQVMMPTPAIVTGACEFSVPLYTIDVEGFKLPFSLQYKSNGIKPDDDPQPIGYGWVLTPPLRISRQILGRPDEYFTFVGDQGSSFVDEDNDNGYKCLTMHGVTNEMLYTDFYDTEHDIFTIYLLDNTLTLVYDNGVFKGVNCDEYVIECGRLLSYISVTDPSGNIYKFGTSGEYIDYPNMRTEWLLTSITLQSGSVINIDWKHTNHGDHGFMVHGPTTVFYNTDYRPFTHINGAWNTELTKPHTYYNTHDLGRITFPGGRMEFAYGGTPMMLKSITLINDSEKCIFSANLFHNDEGKLLSKVNVSNEGTYSFEYDPTTFSRGDMVDWWGFYNGKNNSYRLPPTLKMTQEVNNGNEIMGADRSVDTQKMRAYILTKAIYPTGGFVKWEYEPHRFPKQSPPIWLSNHLTNAVPLSEGGGLRVKTISMKEHTLSDTERIKTYSYGKGGNGLAQITAAPLLHTFLKETPHLCVRHHVGTINVTIDKCLSINTTSDYLTGNFSGFPIWYDCVTEFDAEGKTEYGFEKLCPMNQVMRTWGEAYPWCIYDIFSKGPVQTYYSEYKSTNSGYQLIKNTEFTYNLINNKDIKSFDNFTAKRNCLFLYPTVYAPDFGPDRYQIIGLMNWQYELGDHPQTPFDASRMIDRDNIYWYEGVDYSIELHTEQLIKKRVTSYYDNIHSVINERYEYIPGTNLLSAKVISDNTDSIRTEYTYIDAYSIAINNAMKARNICGMLTGVKEITGNTTMGYSCETGQFGSTFRPKRIWMELNGTKWDNGIYEYDTKGLLAKFTSVSGNVTQWTRDSYGNPLTMSMASGRLVSKATWQNMIGISSLTAPSGIKQTFKYDDAGYLIESSLNSRVQRSYSYRINQDGQNRRTTANYISSEKHYDEISIFDGLGRLKVLLQQQPEGSYCASLTEFDIMGRAHRLWAPVSTLSSFPTSESIKSIATNYYGDSYAYTSYSYEESQRELPEASIRSGRAWHTTDKAAKIKYHTNTHQGSFTCPRYRVTENGVEFKSNYQQGQLIVEETVDEDGITVEVYNDYRGLMVGRRENGLFTAFVYDNAGNLRYILPPGLSGTHSRTDIAMQQLAYWYDYDSRGRLVTKKFPGIKATRLLYDPANRLVAEQNAHHATGAWRFYGYDNADRQVIAIDCYVSDTQASTFASICRTAVLSSSGTLSGYILSGIPLGAEVVWAKYYDDYQFITYNSLSDEFNWKAISDLPSYNTHSSSSLGLQTGTYTGKGFESYHYNTDGNLMQSYSTGFDCGRHNIFYGYDGQPVKIESVYPKEGWPTLTTTLVYDEVGRLITRTITHGDGLLGRVATLTSSYNSIGQLSGLTLGAVSRNFTYDIHGWLKSSQTKVGDKHRSETLFYADGTNPCYNGNISAKQFTEGRYDYTYDNHNRLITARYSDNDSAKDFSTSYFYDDRSNITTLNRKGIIDKAGDSEIFGLLDNLNLSYSGNQLKSVDATTEALPFDEITGIGQNRSDMSISYDASGRIYTDETRGITLIEYNNNGYPIRIVFENGNEQHDIWDGLGNHLTTEYYSPRALGGNRPFAVKKYGGKGQIEYQVEISTGIQKKALAYTSFPGGYFNQNGIPFYYITDYQGNNAMIVNSVPEITLEHNYYPYGEPWREKKGIQFMFSGNERLLIDGLNEYDFHARRYRSAIPAFSSWDLHNEQYPWLSPYTYAAANPINRIDPNGEDIVVLNYGTGMRQHLAMLIQDENRKWQYYSVNGNNMYIPFIDKRIGGRPFNDVAVGSWNTPEDFFYSSYNERTDDSNDDRSKNDYGFPEGYQIQTTPDQDAIMKAEFIKIAKTKYNLIFNNCAVAVQKVMIEAGIPVSEPTYVPYIIPQMSVFFNLVDVFNGYKMDCDINIIPTNAFQSIMNWNPDGKYIQK